MTSIYPSLEGLKSDQFVDVILRPLYPILDDYVGLELGIIVQKISVSIPIHKLSFQSTNGVRELMLNKDLENYKALKLTKFNQGIFVSYVERNSEADVAGFRFGHQILQINDTLVKGMSLDKVEKMLQEYSELNYNVIVVRNRPLERTIYLHKDGAGNFGFQIKNGKIINIIQNSSAAYNGVLVDYQLLEVNRKYVFDMNDDQIEDILANSPSIINITIIPESIYDHMIKKIIPSLDEQDK